MEVVEKKKRVVVDEEPQAAAPTALAGMSDREMDARMKRTMRMLEMNAMMQAEKSLQRQNAPPTPAPAQAAKTPVDQIADYVASVKEQKTKLEGAIAQMGELVQPNPLDRIMNSEFGKGLGQVLGSVAVDTMNDIALKMKMKMQERQMAAQQAAQQPAPAPQPQALPQQTAQQSPPQPGQAPQAQQEIRLNDEDRLLIQSIFTDVTQKMEALGARIDSIEKPQQPLAAPASAPVVPIQPPPTPTPPPTPVPAPPEPEIDPSQPFLDAEPPKRKKVKKAPRKVVKKAPVEQPVPEEMVTDDIEIMEMPHDVPHAEQPVEISKDEKPHPVDPKTGKPLRVIRAYEQYSKPEEPKKKVSVCQNNPK